MITINKNGTQLLFENVQEVRHMYLIYIYSKMGQ